MATKVRIAQLEIRNEREGNRETLYDVTAHMVIDSSLGEFRAAVPVDNVNSLHLAMTQARERLEEWAKAVARAATARS